jgi:hypothetical protein
MDIDRTTATAFWTVTLMHFPNLRLDQIIRYALRKAQKGPGALTFVIAETELSLSFSTKDDRCSTVATFGHASFLLVFCLPLQDAEADTL